MLVKEAAASRHKCAESFLNVNLFVLLLADPWLWSHHQVCQWLIWATNEFSLVNVNFERFAMDGQELCRLGKERFLELAPDYVGDILWEHLDQMIKGK